MSQLIIKVSIARRPTSNKARAIRIVAGFGDRVTTNNAAFYAELSFAQYGSVALEKVVRAALAATCAAKYQLKIATEVNNIAL
jgi:hypothetical protein